MQVSQQMLLILVMCSTALGPLQAGQDGAATHDEHDHVEADVDSTHIPADIAAAVGISTAVAGPGQIEQTITTYGHLVAIPAQMSRVSARFPGLVTQVQVQLGETVSAGAALATIESNESLQSYVLRAPASGVVTERRINAGETTLDKPLFTIADYSALWAELQVFPGQRSAVAAGRNVRVWGRAFKQQGSVFQLMPTPADTPFTLARVVIDNSSGLLSPGLAVTGEIVVETVAAALVVNNSALQTLGGRTGVFVQLDDSYEFHPLQLGRHDSQATEVLAGLQAGDRYVVENSYLIKADLEKSGATHDH